jgi:hypothetical protein
LSSVNGNDRGETVTPDLSLQVRNQYEQLIPPGVMIRVGDLIRFVVALNRNSKYLPTETKVSSIDIYHELSSASSFSFL